MFDDFSIKPSTENTAYNSISLRSHITIVLLHGFLICQDNVFSSSIFLLGSEGEW